jgi:molybdopterin-containing oxidoreductase family iron-sulfur binding subunit
MKSNRTYWRSLDELADTPEFRQWVEREFPAGASELTDPLTRRHFVKIMSASFMLAGVGLAGGGCRRPVERIEPFSKNPENYVHGVPQYYATAMPTRSGAIPLVVKSNDGRPTKIEGNAQHPDSNGSTDRFAQASILNLYDPDRATRFAKGGNLVSAAAAMDFLDTLSKKAAANGGQGLAFLLEQNNSPSRVRLLKQLAARLPRARWATYEAIDLDIHRRAAKKAFGQSLKPWHRFDAAKVIVSLDCDFIGSEEDAHNNIRRFAEGRHIENPDGSLNRLYVVESLMSLTGINADHRLRIPSSAVARAAAALAGEILPGGAVSGLQAFEKLAGAEAKWVAQCAKDLLANRGQSLVVAGYRQPEAVHLLAHALNDALGNLGKTVSLLPAEDAGAFPDLVEHLNAGQVETLVILGGNPAYNAPADVDFAAAQSKAKTIVRLGYYEDESFPARGDDWHLPAAHYLESWGDAQTSDGTLVPIQPLIAPLFGGLTEIEVLARIGGEAVTSPYAIVRETFARYVKDANVEVAWRKFLHDGFLANSAAQPVEAKLNHVAVSEALAGFKQAAAPDKDHLEVVLFRDYKVDDGRYNNNGWLQELPDPITKMVWDNAVLISRKTAGELGVKNLDVVEIQLGERSVRGPIWVQPGLGDYTLGLALGYGRKKTGRVGAGTGFDAYPLRAGENGDISVGATLRALGTTYKLSCTQSHWSMEGRPIIREANLAEYKKHPGFAKFMDEEKPPVDAPLYPNPFDKLKESGLHQWGMSIDLNRCVGCSACMMACQSENNVPIVGKDQVSRGREMHWIRIDRYYAGKPLAKQGTPEARQDFLDTFQVEADQQFQDWIDNPQVVTQPMLCQHCESAPCENVCPVNATSHDTEGLNVMTYNRCVGTRYCSNNCPYKVRRFNFFDFNKRPIGKFYLGPFGHRRDDEWDLLKMVKNPDVTVRMRGVMEKCTFCIQRIQQAKIAQKDKAGATGDVIVPTDSFTTACAQACPAGAIVFGNLKDPESRVSKLKKQERDYTVLEMLLTKPRLTYLARVRNPNTDMPDYQETPLSVQEYEQKTGETLENKAETEGANPSEKGEH